MRLHPTLVADRAGEYLRAGGPWDIGCLDTLLSAAPARDGAVVDGELILSGAELEDRVAHLAGALRELGVGHGDVVAWQLPNIAEVIVLCRACWRLAAIAAPLHHRSGAGELDAMLSLLEPSVTIAAEGMALSGAEGVRLLGGDDHQVLTGGPPLSATAATGEDLALVQFTSGSTGVPKAVLHSHRSLGVKALQMVAAHGLSTEDATLVQSPISHISGMLNGVLVPGVAGMGHVLMDRWDPERALELIAGESISFMVGPPAVFLSLVEAPGFSGAAVESLRLVSCGATGITPEFVADMAGRLGAVVKRSYGCTEAPTLTTSAVGDPPDRGASTDGRPLGSTELRIADPQTAAPLATGLTGEVLVRGPELFAGYAVASQTEAAMADGWFRTGDLGRIDPDGWLTLEGRLKDVIIRNGENIAPAEVERVLELHPGVRQAVVVGVPDERLGERVAAFVTGDGGLDPDACGEWFVEQGVARFKAPEVVFEVDELPLLSLGKPDRASLRSRAEELCR